MLVRRKYKKNIKIILIVLSVLVGIILLDTLQAKAFNNKPIIKIVEYYDGGNLYQKHKDILVDTYVYTDGSQKTYYKWTSRLYDETNKFNKEKVNWTKAWSTKYSILKQYQKEVDIKKYSNEIRKLLNNIQNDYGYSNEDAMLVLKDILAHEYLDNKKEK